MTVGAGAGAGVGAGMPSLFWFLLLVSRSLSQEPVHKVRVMTRAGAVWKGERTEPRVVQRVQK